MPEALYARLKESAERNRRSLNSEIFIRLEASFSAPVARFLQAEHSRVGRYKRKGRP